MNLTEREVDDLLAVPFSFVRRPRPAPADGRPIWRIPYVLFLVRACRQQRAKLEQIHVLNWAMRTNEDPEGMASSLSGDVPIERAIVRYEPALDRAISLAAGLGFLRFESKSWQLTDQARDLLEVLDADEHLFVREKRMLQALSAPLTQTAVTRLIRARVRV